MTAPVLNRRLVLEEAQRMPDGAGGYSLDWQALGEVWAQVTPGTGVERAGEFVTLASVPFRIVLRAAPEGSPRRPRPEQRFRDGTRIFRILAVAEHDMRGHYLTCFTREEVVA
ncbi:head-tail adaptor protein [Pseudothioclava nitratireducens]|jgi:head-tail adaptor|uniref:head-tail adaptor protein n=1 Tax=Pseudothioclava nitratireducens TaxID=1928646 RepID=UPI0023DBC19F|nr:head-tail adaptor protein [Defluviimonas nitratireducens]MDF1621289.1 head-tail adaptor protein [Defluviimonas nitratireducens]